MLEILSHLFGAVCGQDPGHTWAPGGILLPCCQRCTGLYVGAGLAALLHLCLRPKLSGRFLEIHGAFLLVMAPFGFHWVDQGPVLRTLTGVLFGSALVTFLWLPLSQRAAEQGSRPLHVRPSAWSYFLVLGATLILLPGTARLGGTIAAYALSGLAFFGVLALVALVVGNVSLGLLGALRLSRRLTCSRLQP
ncbi:MAG: DUF2085 domain-containing protein [Verrucomicrobiota bacterium]|jgi:uncharacterized membrane protein